MHKWLIGVFVAAASVALVAPDADAARLGGARSSGVQRSVTRTPPASVPAKPAQQQGAQQAAPAGQQPAAAQSGFRRWMPLLGGLALGGLLGAMFGGSGVGALFGVLLVAGLLLAAVMAFRAMARSGTPQPRPAQLAGFGNETVAAPPPSQAVGLSAAPGATRPQGPAVPAGFDTAGFLRGAKMNFMRLQVANDSGNLEEIRELTTGELFEDLKRDVLERGAGKQQTDVVSLEAELLELTTEGAMHWASVRFAGMVRETPGSAAEAFEEVWNLCKPVDGSSGWLLAGIQQME